MNIADLSVFREADETKVLTPEGLALLVYCLVASRTDFDEGDQDETDALFALVEETLIS